MSRGGPRPRVTSDQITGLTPYTVTHPGEMEAPATGRISERSPRKPLQHVRYVERILLSLQRNKVRITRSPSNIVSFLPALRARGS